MLLLTKSVLATFIGLIFSVCMACIIIPILRKLKASQSLSIYLDERHKEKKGTPTMGGLIFLIPTILIMWLFYITHKI